MIYDYASNCGKGFEYECPMGEAPNEIVVNKITFWRDYSKQQPVGRVDKDFVAFSQPLKGSRWDNGPAAPNYDNEGRAVMTRSQAREHAKKTETEDGGYEFDG